ncbi:NADH-quinone oxidoreductase subunit C/D [Shewanella eurypsychrophilus]|uniref:NADH-quinone oxidoreductase subunit C/D n=1 Tax=Shewanella eurypsychrophilus TaxID=2593656 RepID=A0ABX6V953_9GAMM|nr:MULTISPECIES: NADH-quinone oxidoreductase subunit C/D [Shewanella]QFU23310.1 NADH-quinone oxidoreductase subunit C/D [Shewanella sp. YLB-09]QPG58539.1 NADH-quinone oxidoreductase subunit C/D [Shewanella eurypsychrophilus]
MDTVTKELSIKPVNPHTKLTLAMLPELGDVIPNNIFEQQTADNILTLWIDKKLLFPVLKLLKSIPEPFNFLFDLYAIDERLRLDKAQLPAKAFTLVYQLMSIERNQDIRLKVALEDNEEQSSITSFWPSANWYEREIWDLFGIVFNEHPNLYRILLPPTYLGHPLRKEFPCRATEMEPFSLDDEKLAKEQEALRFDPKAWGMEESSEDNDYLFLNLGPNHPSVHGVFRIALQLHGEQIKNAVPDIGYHHRGAEKIAERQTWHGFIPYTDRIDYLGGVMNNFPYILAIEQLANIQVSERVKCIRVMLAECFRILSHMLFFGTFAQDVGQLSPIFYLFIDREKLFSIIEAITGARMHPSWFRIGGVAQDLPQGWHIMMQEFVDYFPSKLDEYEVMVMQNSILKHRAIGIGKYNTQQALEWNVSGVGLRATGADWDLRKQRPYSGYENYQFDIPTASNGDAYDRCQLRVDEMRQSLKIIQQCIDHMPAGDYKADHPLTTPPKTERSKQDIETLIQHFLNVSWGAVMPKGESCFAVEATKGINAYSLISDGSSSSYRTRIRTPSFAHLQMIPLMAKGLMVADLIVILASIDFVMADVDR